jgi:hypothetical protein
MEYKLFIGDIAGKLSSQLASGYLSGQSFAFEVAAVLLVVAALFSAAKGQIGSVKY